jgi:hypothetical protein
MKKRCQVAMEYITILGFVAVTTLVMVIIFHAHATVLNDSVVSHQVERLAEKIIDTAEAVYYIGDPSRTKIKLYFPPQITNVTINNRELVFFVKTSFGVDEVVKVSQVNLTGTLPITGGIHYIQVQAQEGEVFLS